MQTKHWQYARILGNIAKASFSMDYDQKNLQMERFLLGRFKPYPGLKTNAAHH